MFQRWLLLKFIFASLLSLSYTLSSFAETVVVLGYGRTGKVFTHKLHQKLGDDTKIVIVDTEPKRIDEARERWGREPDQHTFTYKTHYDQVLEGEWADTIFVQELITENVKAKQALIDGVLNKLESAGKTDVVVASNTSSIPVSVLTEHLPEHQKTRVSVNHMYSPHGSYDHFWCLKRKTGGVPCQKHS
ncbi:3-hydroxyacyl-CoA dehydrogenase NAD-binding domain-containing protein [Endozoicomonas atrinae]|uniref:3-hydroxyacyl-CoA dehydrogenase NAD-binding domain-containing protein n=1 Tax=Endozoicomonas atrinae TaxID=1333660 RepID=UPI003B002ACA